MNIVFVYHPRSGARWLPDVGPRAGLAIPLVEWGNGCAHVLGAHIRLETAAPNQWWRLAAREAAATIARHFGGVAWDACGEVNLVVPPATAATALVLVWAADPHQAHYYGDKLLPIPYDAVRTLCRTLGAAEGIGVALRNIETDPVSGHFYALVSENEGKTSAELRHVTGTGDALAAIITAPWPVSAIYGAHVPAPPAD